VARAARAVRDVMAAIDAGDLPGPRAALRSYLVGVVVTLDTLTVERTQEGSRKDIPTDIDNGQGR